jgi:sulfite reductase (NADPH) hemoprotein beta-component
MDAVADLADRFSLGRLVVTHRQNLVLTDVKVRDLHDLWGELQRLDLATPNVGRVTDVIACPGLDYCNLANARSLSIAADLSRRFADADAQADVGELTLNISGCINACGHHHVGHVGILGIDKQGVEHYQLMLGGSSATDASLGEVLGPALQHDEVGPAVERLLARYRALRAEGERFLDCYRRVGAAPFREAIYESGPLGDVRTAGFDGALAGEAAE